MINYDIEIDLLENKKISWEDFSNYLISKASTIGGLMGSNKNASGGGKQAMNVAGSTGGGSSGDEVTMQTVMGSIEKIKSFSLALTVSIPPKDKEKHK